ncbi:Hypothetical predicted protein [Mytilus galloprovincialis]|uniref:Endonuclease/exonuclease/phosphatase domain-containing protein n=1 Tax=Mytilus galloprovincialis TaxID=29158 RepID=A0A8B6DWF8_MYTGA|nr:Hypothetical predicted protein [Mytilus galloprovincialis]
MKILFINCQSFNTAYGLNSTIEKYDVDILCLNETFENTNNPVKLKDWTVYSSPRPNKSRGGTAICIRPSLNYISEHIISKQLDSIEMTCVKITFKDKKIINIWCPYIPPEKPYLMDELCKHINNKITDNTVIVGDLNAKSYQWNNKTENIHGKLLEECMNKSKLICVNDCQASRRNSDSIIDLSLITQNLYNEVIECTTLSHENIQSDHIAIFTKLNSCTNTQVPLENETPKFNINKADLDAWKTATEESFQNLEFFNNQSIEEIYQIFEDKMMLCMENIIPKTTRNIRKHHKPCWWNKTVEEKKHLLNKCQREFKLKNTPTNLTKLMEAESSFTDAKDEAVDEWSALLCTQLNGSKNLKEKWSNFKKLTKKNENNLVLPFLDSNGNILFEEEDKEKILEDTFFKGNHLNANNFDNDFLH